MAYTLNLDHVSAAFSSGSLPNGGKPVKFHTVEIGAVVVTSGLLSVADPFVDCEQAAFARKVPNGKHPVSLAIARFKNGDERVAFAQVKLSDEPAVRWHMALRKGQALATLKKNQFFGYGVDSGTGAFLDPRAGKLLWKKMAEDDDYFDFMVEKSRKTYRATRSWFDCRPYRKHPENLICFSTGWGDGSYPSFFGLSSDRRPSVLLTDFLLLKPTSVKK